MSTAAISPARFTRLTLPTVERALFGATVLLGVALMWLAPRLPMTDLPQHAAQVALWRDLLLGTSPWADLVRINLLTPYLIGYGLMLPLSFIVPLDVAARIVLSLAFLGFVAGSVALRRALKGDRRLDWLGLLGFFGFAWQWGFLTFLVAAPLGLAFLVLAARHAGAPAWRGAAWLIVSGLTLLLSHGLIFLMAIGLGGLLTLRTMRRGYPLGMALSPYAVLVAIAALFRLLTRNADGAMQFDVVKYGIALGDRVVASLIYVEGTGTSLDVPLLLLTCVALLAPVMMGVRLNREGGVWLFIGLAVALVALPSYAFQTAYLFQRFTLFLLPFYALLFRAPAEPQEGRSLAGLIVIAGSCWLTLGIQAARIADFAGESRSFDTVAAAAEPGHRALALIYDRGSPAAHNTEAYMHYAAWYQADKHGFVDFNFASFHPQVVRFRPGRKPAVTDRLGWTPEMFDWSRPESRVYDYVFLRGGPGDVAAVIKASPCRLTIAAQDGPWSLLSRGACPA